MYNKELTRDNINYQITGLGMQLRYLKDALMYSFLGIPLEKFFILRGNIPVVMEERMPFLDKEVARFDVPFWKEVKRFLFNSNDKELAEKFCELDKVIWQLAVLSSRFEDEHVAILRIREMATEMLQLVYDLKTEMLRNKFFEFDGLAKMEEVILLDEMDFEASNAKAVKDKYAGWGQLEDAVKACREKAKQEKQNLKTLLADGRFELTTPICVKNVYDFLCYGYKFGGERKPYDGVIDPAYITEEALEQALMSGCYFGFKEHSRNDQLYFFICRFSKAYVEDVKTYRQIAASSLGTTVSNLEKYNKIDGYAEGLRRTLTKIKYNNM